MLLIIIKQIFYLTYLLQFHADIKIHTIILDNSYNGKNSSQDAGKSLTSMWGVSSLGREKIESFISFKLCDY